MGEIRPFESSHIPEVASLQLKILRRKQGPAKQSLLRYFEEIFFRNPWRADDLPSFVYLHQGKLVGFLGVIPRPMLFENRPVRAAIATQFMVDRDVYRGYAGLEMLKRFFGGPQDFSYTDGATEAAATTWTATGAYAASLFALEWTRVLHPAAYVRSILAGTKGKFRLAGKLLTPVGLIADAALAHTPVRFLARPDPPFPARPASADQLLNAMQSIGWRNALKPSYDAASFSWLIGQTADATQHGELRLAVVKGSEGETLGCFAYFAKPRGVATVMQFSARHRAFLPVFEALLRDAWDQGSAAVRGQVIPACLTHFTEQHCSLRHLGSGVLIHSRNAALLAAVLRGDAALSRLDGEWWMRFAVAEWE